MQRLLLSLLLLGFLIFCFSQVKNDPVLVNQKFQQAEKLFKEAEKRSEKAGDDEGLAAIADSIYRQALKAYDDLISLSDHLHNDSISFLSRIRAAYIDNAFDSLPVAKKRFLEASQSLAKTFVRDHVNQTGPSRLTEIIAAFIICAISSWTPSRSIGALCR